MESDQTWINKINELVDKKTKIFLIDIGITGDWGMPLDKSRIDDWSKYSLAIEGKSPDIILVDGRFRVACICRSILNIKEDGLIIIHDFWNRPHYHTVLPFLEVYDKVETLAIFKVKKDISIDDVNALWEEYKTNFA